MQAEIFRYFWRAPCLLVETRGFVFRGRMGYDVAEILQNSILAPRN